MFVGVLLAQLTFGHSYWCDFMIMFSDTPSHNSLPVLLDITIFLSPFLHCYVSLRFSSCVIDVSSGSGIQNILQFH